MLVRIVFNFHQIEATKSFAGENDTHQEGKKTRRATNQLSSDSQLSSILNSFFFRILIPVVRVLLERKLAMVIQQIREEGVDFLMLRHEGDFFGFIEKLLEDKGFKIIETSVDGLRPEKSRNRFALGLSG